METSGKCLQQKFDVIFQLCHMQAKGPFGWRGLIFKFNLIHNCLFYKSGFTFWQFMLKHRNFK